MKLTPFEKTDWWAFSGCESSNPEIAHQDYGTIILDGPSIQVFVNHADDDYEQQDFYLLKVPSPRAAKAIADALPEVLTSDILKEFEFTYVE